MAMTVIVWDGKTLAADKRGTYGYVGLKTTKIKKHNNYLLGSCGNSNYGRALVDWFISGGDTEEFPEAIDSDNGGSLMVITPDRKILYYDRYPYPLVIEGPFHAIGSGSELATGALAMGADAIRAVEIACIYDTGSGNGIDTLEHDA
jgi:20S proteasome alpha/beta subunit